MPMFFLKDNKISHCTHLKNIFLCNISYHSSIGNVFAFIGMAKSLIVHFRKKVEVSAKDKSLEIDCRFFLNKKYCIFLEN